MNKTLCYWQLAGFTAVSVLGTLLHFLYAFTGSLTAALVASTNESTWEHMKLLFFPMLFFAWFQHFFIGANHPDFWCIKCRGILLGLLTIPVLFYTLSGVFGTLPGWINISIFFVSAAIGFIYETCLFNQNAPSCNECLCVCVLCLVAAAFFLFTFWPPRLPLFLDPVTKTYGL